MALMSTKLGKLTTTVYDLAGAGDHDAERSYILAQHRIPGLCGLDPCGGLTPSASRSRTSHGDVHLKAPFLLRSGMIEERSLQRGQHLFISLESRP